MTLLDLLEHLAQLPAEAWLIPPVLIVASIAAVGLMLHRARRRRYRAIAARTGLSVRPKIVNASEVHGTFRGRELVMVMCSRQRPTIRRRWTLVTVDVKNPEYVGLFMRPQDAVDNAIMAVGGKDVQVGDADFDRRFVIQSREAELVTRLFQSRELRELLLDAQIDSVRLVSSTLQVYYAREERKPEHAERLFTAVTRLADAIDALEAEHRAESIGD